MDKQVVVCTYYHFVCKAGKTFTMEGRSEPELRGIIPNSFSHIFETISLEKTKKFLVHASYLEIYNENIRDLLGDDPHASLNLREDPDRGVYVDKLTKISVKDAVTIMELMTQGNSHRAVGATEMNKDSSRSHSIFVVRIESSDADGENIKAGKLNLVDLAGSERQSKTKAQGTRLKEATKINLSLSALGNVISALVEGGKNKHIPYRDSKLTRLLQDSLGGNTKTIMIAAVSPADYNYDETLSTLRYANRAKNIKNAPKINQDPKDALLLEYQGEIARLKEMLEKLKIDPTPELVSPMLMSAPVAFQSVVPSNSSSHSPKLIAQDNPQLQVAETKIITKEVVKVITDPNLLDHISKLEAEKQEHAQKAKEAAKIADEQAKKAQEMKKMHEQHEQEKIILEQHLKLLQDALLDGGKKVESVNAEKELKEREVQLIIERQKKKELALRKEIDKQQAVASSVEKKYTSLTEQLQNQLADMTLKWQQATVEIKDLTKEFEDDREGYLSTIRDLEREKSLHKQIIAEIMASSDLEKIVLASKYSEGREEWILPPFTFEPVRVELKREKKSDGLNFAISNAVPSAPAARAGLTQRSLNPIEGVEDRREALYETIKRGVHLAKGNAGFVQLPSRPVFAPAAAMTFAQSSGATKFAPDLTASLQFKVFEQPEISAPKHRLDATQIVVPNRPAFTPDVSGSELFTKKSIDASNAALLSIPTNKSPFQSPIQPVNNLNQTSDDTEVQPTFPNLPRRPAFEPAVSNVLGKSLNKAVIAQPLVPDVVLSRPKFEPAPPPSSKEKKIVMSIPSKSVFVPADTLNEGVSECNDTSGGINSIPTLYGIPQKLITIPDVPSRPGFQPPSVSFDASNISAVPNIPVLPSRPAFQPGK